MMSFGLDSVNMSVLKPEDKTSPLIITPRWDATLAFLRGFLEANRRWIDGMILIHGAILVRGFDVGSAADMEVAVRGYQPSLNNTYRGTSPRNTLGGTEYIFSAAEVPTHYPSK